MLGHLTQVSMPRGATNQTRTFNYTSGNVVGAHLLSATNPENGTVTYTYSNHLLATKTDAAGNQFTYVYDSLHRLQTVSANGNVLRTYTYDSNTIDAAYSQYTAGRLATVTYPAYTYDAVVNGQQGTTTFTDMFSYSQPGAIVGKRLRVTKTNPYTQFNQQYTQTAVGDLNLAYAYNNEGKPTTVTYPTDVNNNTPSYNYSYDAMMRPQGMTDQSSNPVVSNVQYGAANQLLQMTYGSGTETRSYNNMLQLTNISGLGQNITYTFPSANNGKISSQTDAVSGETISYQYDSLNRLISASASTWTQTQTYDGFGNLTARTGTGAAQSTTITTPADPTTNRLSAGYSYDANGNQYGAGYHYDAENRLTQVNMSGGTMQYGYDGANKRIWQGSFTTQSDPQYLTSDTVSLFGVDGKLIGTYIPFADWTNHQNQIITFTVSQTRVYFGSKLIKWVDNAGTPHPAVQDRLGSIGKYYPYGEERNPPPPPQPDQVKFATYTRDSATGNDYADQRYYTNNLGRFMTPDPYSGSAQANRPQSWNRYSYTLGDPVNLNDPTGRRSADVCPRSPENSSQPDGVFHCDPDPGGGGDGDGPDPDQTLSDAKSYANYLMAHDEWTVNPDCLADITLITGMSGTAMAGKHVTAEDIILAAGKVVTGEVKIGLSTSTDVLPNDGRTVAQFFADENAEGVFPLAITPVGGNAIYYLVGGTDPNYFKNLGNTDPKPYAYPGEWWNKGWNIATMMHELLHTLGFTDDDLTNSLLGDPKANSGKVSTKLRDDCFPTVK